MYGIEYIKPTLVWIVTTIVVSLVLVFTIYPVSYTHLDVYKRQVVDVIEKRLELAKKLGAARVINGKEEDTVAVLRSEEMYGDHGLSLIHILIKLRLRQKMCLMP